MRIRGSGRSSSPSTPTTTSFSGHASSGFEDDRITAIHGGATRQESTRLALRALRDDAPDMVLIHDAVRPFVDAGLIDRAIAAIDERQAALPAMPVADTLKRMNGDGNVGETVPRAGLHAAQTPQGFPFWPILAAHEKAFQLGKNDFTDDAAIAEWAKHSGADRHGLARQREAHLGTGHRHGRPAAWQRQTGLSRCAHRQRL